MIFQSRVNAPVQLEPIAFADIVINLFIFFFLSFGLFATFHGKEETAFPVALPKVSQAFSRHRAASNIVTVQKSGNIFVNRKAVPFKQLISELNWQMTSSDQRKVTLRADKDLKLETFFPVLEAVKNSSAEAVAIEVDQR